MLSMLSTCNASLLGNNIISLWASQLNNFNRIGLYTWFFIILVFILIIATVYDPKIYSRFIKYISSCLKTLKTMVGGNQVGRVTGNNELGKTIETAGYSYDSNQDIFYSSMDAWQRTMGYCRLYDEACAPLGMIIDCEPVYFEYDQKKWLIEFWKGQYALTTGCEIGVYTATGPSIYINGVFNGTFYNCASNADQLQMTLTLKKNDKTLFTRSENHWWLSGFKLGEFSEPSELTLDLIITLKNEIMLNSFLIGLKKAGYNENEIIINKNTVSLNFNKTRTPQPISRTIQIDRIMQTKNKLLCDRYRDITKQYDNLPDKIKAIHQQAPDIYEKIRSIGKNQRIFRNYEKIKSYLNEI